MAASIITVGLYEITHQELRSPWRLFTERVLSIGSYYLIALPLALLFLRLGQLRRKQLTPLNGTWHLFVDRYLRPRSVFGDLRALLLCVVLFVLFIQLKHLIPFIHSKTYDHLFQNSERAIFSGKLFSDVVRDYIGVKHAPLLSEGYFLFYPYVAILIYIFILQRNTRLREEFLLGFVLCWLVGIVLVYMIPTLGPCFTESRFLNELPQTGVQEMQMKLIKQRESVFRTGRGVYLISGFPSLHVAITVYGTMLLWKLSRILSVISFFIVLLTIVTTLYFGWHYLVDDIAGALIAVAVAVYVSRYFRPFVLSFGECSLTR